MIGFAFNPNDELPILPISNCVRVCQRSQRSDCSASKTVVRPSNADCAISFALRWSDSDAGGSINVRSMAKKYMRPNCGGERANIH
jgi:hypothetical protein